MKKEVRLIDANELMQTMESNLYWGLDSDGAILDTIYEAPTVDSVEVVHGRWREKILVGGFAEEWGFVCSECGCTVSDRSNLGIGRYASNNQRLNYCPNCGAKMDGDGDG